MNEDAEAARIIKRMVKYGHARWCAFVYDSISMYAHGLFPIFEHECNCPARQKWLGNL